MFVLKFVACTVWLMWALVISMLCIADQTHTGGVMLATWAVFVFGPLTPIGAWQLLGQLLKSAKGAGA
jgi:hypothetical protein